MKFFHGLIIGFLSVACGYSQNSQPSAKAPELMFRTVGIGDITPLTGLLYDYNKKPAIVTTPYANLSATYGRQDTPAFVLYREVAPVPPETKPTKLPVVTAQLGKDPLYLVFLIASRTDPKAPITSVIVNDSWEAHPVDTVRIFNFSHRRVAVQIEDTMTELPSAGSALFPYPKNKGIIRFKVATFTLESSGWKLRSSTPQGIIPGTRSYILIEDFKPELIDPNPEDINIFNIVDPLPPPPPPNQMVAGLRPRQQ